MAGAKGDPTAMVAAADELKVEAARGRQPRTSSVSLDRRLRHVERLQHRQPHGDDEVGALLAGR